MDIQASHGSMKLLSTWLTPGSHLLYNTLARHPKYPYSHSLGWDGGEHNYASNITKQMHSILARTGHLPGTDPKNENPSRAGHTPTTRCTKHTRRIYEGADLRRRSREPRALFV